MDTLTANIPQIVQITPEISKQANIQYETRTFTFSVTGNYPNVFAIRTLRLALGRFYSAEDEIQHARVAVIGSEAKEKLFSGRTQVPQFFSQRPSLAGTCRHVLCISFAKRY